MNPRELVDHIRSGPAELVLCEPLRFRRRTRSNPCDFNEFIQALQSSETIRTVKCHLQLGISEDEWVILIKTLGRIRDIRVLELFCTNGSRDLHPFQAFADAVKNAQSLRKLVIGLGGEIVPSDPSGLTALASALRTHTGLHEFSWIDMCPRLESAQITAFDSVLRALPACPHLREVKVVTKCASADAMKNLLQLTPATKLRLLLDTDQWLAMADEIRRGRCNVQRLALVMRQIATSDATEAVKAVASAIRLDRNLEHLLLQMDNGFTTEAGVALAEALAVNKTLRKIDLSDTAHGGRNVHNRATLGTQAYEALSAMLRVNTSLVLKLPPFETDGADERLRESRKQMVIEQRLNQVGRGRLLSSRQTTREEWVDALHALNAIKKGTDRFDVSCMYSLLRLNPSVCLLELNHTANPGT
jgi:hypothetical protein